MSEPLELKSLVYDNTSGAREIAARTLQFLQQRATRSEAPTPTALLDELADLGVKVIRSHPEMAPLLSVVNEFLLAAEGREDAPDVGTLRLDLVPLLQEHARRLHEAWSETARHAAELVQNGQVVLTYSRSSTIGAALTRAKAAGKVFDVVVSEARPHLEGRTLAKELADAQVPVRLVVDAALPAAVEGVDAVLLGADTLTQTHVVNKVGTFALALAARERNIPVFVAADRSKAWLRRADPGVGHLTGRVRDPREVWDQAPHGVEVVNLYFESTPVSLFRGVVSESGVQTPAVFWNGVRARGIAKRVRSALGSELS